MRLSLCVVRTVRLLARRLSRSAMIAAGGEHHVMPLFFQVISEIKALGVSQCFETILLFTDS